MTLISAPPEPSLSDLEPCGRIVLEHADWGQYERLLREFSETHIRLTYSDGRLELMSPLPEHERWKKRIGRLIEMLTLQRDMPLASFGSTTFRRKKLRKGLEPDESYYLRNVPSMQTKKRIDLRRDPPPDLVVEIDITHGSIEREPIYAALGVPEIWRFDGITLTGLKLHEGQYQPIQFSLAFPFLAMKDVDRFLKRIDRLGETPALRQFQRWIDRLDR
jgi:Uma2 family endonuclease